MEGEAAYLEATPVIIPDVNVLVHAYDPAFPAHCAAREWWQDTLNLERPVGLAWATVLGFIRLTTNRAVVANPLPARDAIAIVTHLATATERADAGSR